MVFFGFSDEIAAQWEGCYIGREFKEGVAITGKL
jgi:hypothetical protein